MSIWTISAQPGVAGDAVAAALAGAAGVALFDRRALAELAARLNIDIPDVDDVEERFCGRGALALSFATGTGAGAAAAYAELKLRRELPELGRRLVAEAARRPCVIQSSAAFAALPDHPGAVHVRIRAPFACRVAKYQHEELVDRQHAEKALRHAERLEHAWVKFLYGVEVDDPAGYGLILDASRLSQDRLVETLLAAGGVRAGSLVTTNEER
ncbi:MAG TPA: cytidylate kinase family protein [Gaiellaceae bacterium]|nr:cytidylate kinase family protein [Gaiellaceae bacterium]